MKAFADAKNHALINHDRTYLNKLYSEYSSDPEFGADAIIRKGRVLFSQYEILINDKPDEKLTKFFSDEWFTGLLNLSHDNILFGYTVFELQPKTSDVPQFDMINRGLVVPDIHSVQVIDDTGDLQYLIDYTTEEHKKFVCTIGSKSEPDNFGLLYELIPYLILKRNSEQDWGDFARKFGTPIVTIKCASGDETEMNQLKDEFADISELGAVVTDLQNEVSFEETRSTGSHQIFENLAQRCTKIIDKRILGGTMITENGSSLAQGKEHKDVLNQLVEFDRVQLENFINSQVIPLLKLHGYIPNQEIKFRYDRSDSLPLKEQFEIVNGLLQHYTIPAEYIEKTFGIPVEEKQMSLPNPVPPTPKPEPNKPQEPPQNDPQKKKSEPNAELNLPHYTVCEHCGGLEIEGEINITTADLEKAFEKFNRYYHMPNSEEKTQLMANYAVEHGRVIDKALYDTFGSTLNQLQYNAPDHAAYTAMQYNIFDFSGAKSQALALQINAALYDDKGILKPFSEFKKSVESLNTTFNKRYLKTEYNFARAVGQTSREWYDLKKNRDISPSWQYYTAGDGLVRDSHAILSGRTFDLKDGKASNLYPPNGWGCRCYAVPSNNVSKYVTEFQYNEFVNKGSILKGFDVNRSEIQKVFLENQFYIKGGAMELNDLTYKNYGLKPIAELQKGKPELVFANIGTDPAEIAKLFKPNADGVMEFRDYLNRGMSMQKTVFHFHTKGKYLTGEERRQDIFDAIQNILKSPDEVWMKQHQNRYQLRYLKFYQGNTVVVETTIDDNNIFVETWYVLTKEEATKRTGILLK